MDKGQEADYLRRCYTAVDGLWFMKVEEALGFDEALRIDEAVWQVLPKIQARMLKEMLDEWYGIAALYECLTTSLAWSEHDYDSHWAADRRSFTITIRRCPWLELLLKSNREHLAEQVGTRICNAEYGTWAVEFGDDTRPGDELAFCAEELMCQGAAACTLRFSVND